MITARVETGTIDAFIRNRVRVLVEITGPSPSDHVIIGHNNRGDDFYIRPNDDPDRPLPDGATPWALDASRDAAHAVYLALKGHFESSDPVPTISDRAYNDARADLQRAHALIDKLIGAVTAPPTQVLTELRSDPGRTP